MESLSKLVTVVYMPNTVFANEDPQLLETLLVSDTSVF